MFMRILTKMEKLMLVKIMGLFSKIITILRIEFLRQGI